MSLLQNNAKHSNYQTELGEERKVKGLGQRGKNNKKREEE